MSRGRNSKVTAFREDVSKRPALQVKAVEPGAVVVKQGTDPQEKQVAFGTCIWTTGNKMHPLADALAQKLPHGKTPKS